VHISPYTGGELRLKSLYQAHSISDADAARSFEKLKQELPRHRKLLCLQPFAPAFLAKLELPEQNLGDRATRALVEALLFGSVRVAEVYLYKSLLGDAAAQALACLMEHSPKPGITGLHLSHNYFTPLGVKLMIDAARRCKMYPQNQLLPSGKRSSSPLWLRVDHQLIPWPGYEDKEEDEKLKLTEKRVEELDRMLVSKSQADGSIPADLMPWELPRLICIPAPRNPQRLINVDPTMEDGVAEFFQCSDCTKLKCKFASAYGPLVHLPYFWMQGRFPRPWGDELPPTKPPEAASVNLREANWKSWFPRVPRPRVQTQLSLEAPPPTSTAAVQDSAVLKREPSAVVQVKAQPPEKVSLPISGDKQEKPRKDKKDKKEKKEKKKEKKAKKDKRLEQNQEVDASQEPSVAEQLQQEVADLFGSDDDEVSKPMPPLISTSARPPQKQLAVSNAKRRRTATPLSPIVSEKESEHDAAAAVADVEPQDEMPEETDEELEFLD